MGWLWIVVKPLPILCLVWWVIGAPKTAYRDRLAAGLALSLVADPRVASTLVSAAPGRTCLLTGLALEGLAALWMRRIVRCAQ